jgi:excisionase family DNA binding protein
MSNKELGASVETYFTLKEIAKYLGYADKTIRKWILNKEIPFHKIHNTIRFRLSEIEKWIDNDGVFTKTVSSETNEGELIFDDDIQQIENVLIGETTQAGGNE